MFLSLPVIVPFDWAAAIDQALRYTGMKRETLAALMGITPTCLAQQLQGHGQLSFPRLLMVASDPDGRVFWAALLPALAESMRIEDVDAIADRLTQVVRLFQSRMVRASVGHSEQERRRA